MNNPQNIVALAKLVSEKGDAFRNARAELAPGRYDVDLTVNVHGHMTVGADYSTVPTVSIPLKETLALFIHYCGITREAAMNVLRRAMTDSIEATGTGAGALAAALPVVAETMEQVENDILATLPRQPRKGVVRTYLEYEEAKITVG